MAQLIRTSWEETSPTEFRRLAEEFQTPFYLYDVDVICKKIQMIRDLLEHRVKIYYAVKANPNLDILKSVRGIADGLDISSVGELQQAKAAGFEAKQLSFAGPAKSRDELRASIELGVGNISIESKRELSEIISLSKTIGVPARVVVRVNPKFLNRAFGIKMGGRPVQFGIEEESLAEILSIVSANSEYLDFHGIHVYSGSQCFDGQAIVEGIRDTLRIASDIESYSSLRCNTINLGGGFGVSHSKESLELDIASIAQEIIAAIRDYQDARPGGAEIIFELGRYLVADAGIYVSQVISTKDSRGKKFYLLDGGLHHHLAAAGTFGAALRSNFVLRNLSRPDADPVKCNLAGPSCNPTDLLGVDVEIPEPEVGDLIGVLKSGSYGLTASPVLFLGRPTPVELIRRSGNISVARKSMCILDFN